MGLFDKKYCDICGNKIGLLGNNKLADGNMCNDCEKKLSNWFKDRRQSTLTQIKYQLAYRETNAAALPSFRATRQLGTSSDKFFLIDERAGMFIILREGEDMKKNPDILDRALVRAAKLEIEESKREERYKDPNGNFVSYNPKHYSYSYKFNITIDYNGAYFKQLKFPVSYTAVDGGTDDEKYRGQTFGESIGNNFRSQMNLHSNVQVHKPIQVDNYGRRHDLPGGYRTNGLTTMKPLDIERYQEYEAIGNEIVDWLLGKQEDAAPQMTDAALAQAEIARLYSEGKREEAKAVAAKMLASACGVEIPDNEPFDRLEAEVPATWTCTCGAPNTGRFCEYCGTPRP